MQLITATHCGEQFEHENMNAYRPLADQLELARHLEPKQLDQEALRMLNKHRIGNKVVPIPLHDHQSNPYSPRPLHFGNKTMIMANHGQIQSFPEHTYAQIGRHGN